MDREDSVLLAIVTIIVAALVAGGLWYYREHQPPGPESGSQSLPPLMPPSFVTGLNSASLTMRGDITRKPTVSSSRVISATLTHQDSAPSSESLLIAACAGPYDSTTSVGSSLFEIKGNSLFVNGQEQVESIPASLGLVPSNTGIGSQDPNTNPCVNPSGNYPTSTLTFDQYTNMEPSSGGNEVALIYFRDEFVPGSSGFTPTVSKLLLFGAGGILLSSTDLTVWNSISSAYQLFWADGSIVFFDGPTVRFDALDEKGGQTVLTIRDGIVSDITE